MTNSEKIRLIFRKYPETKFSRGKFFWQYLSEFYGIGFFIKEGEFIKFFEGEFWGLERAVRDILKEPEFQLTPEQNAKRYEKASQFKQQYARN